MAVIRPPYDPKRTDLRQVIPLSTPFILFIEPTRLCNLKCFYCMHSTRGNSEGVLERAGIPVRHMDMDLYDKIISDIGRFPEQPKLINFSGLGEPLVNPRLPEMIHKLRKAGYTGRVDIITNGVLLTPEKSTALLEAGVTRFRLSVQALTAERCEEICGVAIDMDKYIANIRWLFEHKGKAEVYAKIIVADLQNEGEIKRFYEIFDEICDYMLAERLILGQQQTVEFRNDYGIGAEIDLYSQPYSNLKACPPVFYMFQVVSDGSVFPCGAPGLPLSFSIGNCKEHSLKELWDSDARYSLVKKMLTVGASQIPICNKCDCINTMGYDSVDDSAEELLSRLEVMNLV